MINNVPRYTNLILQIPKRKAFLADAQRNYKALKSFFDRKLEIVNSLSLDPLVIEFLNSFTPSTCTSNHPEFSTIVSYLKTCFEEDDLQQSFLGICVNSDVIDSNGRTRLSDCKSKLQAIHSLADWICYNEAISSNGQSTVTLPYKDFSGLYNMSFAKAVTNSEDGKNIGVIGFDVNLRSVIKAFRPSSYFIIAGPEGQILYSSYCAIEQCLERKYNLKMLVSPTTYKKILSRDNEYIYDKIDSHYSHIWSLPIIDDKYYFIAFN
ncbi:cache domain-containing protein [Desulfuribacillus alkaliarsenatis]|uniref:Uncharacterized protein n=1 Tax=Desulfuribacillus alkaliarsenatis TaxID=766136 RepID=A0A1E5G310_9FIRM|nr:cache domain-containing protein [Desulfuribacillus alkaliarsenatis]OEF97448.1 hypothetical protein BHF68_04355 [Desulfuribacillus alkaliarsenatis]